MEYDLWSTPEIEGEISTCGISSFFPFFSISVRVSQLLRSIWTGQRREARRGRVGRQEREVEQSITRKSGPTFRRGLGVPMPTLAAAGVKTYLTRGTHVDGYIMREWESLLGGEIRDRAPGSVPGDSEQRSKERSGHSIQIAARYSDRISSRFNYRSDPCIIVTGRPRSRPSLISWQSNLGHIP